jgi:hypothetical protein
MKKLNKGYGSIKGYNDVFDKHFVQCNKCGKAIRLS